MKMSDMLCYAISLLVRSIVQYRTYMLAQFINITSRIIIQLDGQLN